MLRNLNFFLILLLLSSHIMAVEIDGQKLKSNDKGTQLDQSASLILQNSALVRLGGQIFFLNDIDRLQESFKSISCLGNNSYIKRFLKNSSELKIPRSWQDQNHTEDRKLPQRLQEFILIEKLKLSSVSSANTTLSTFDLVKLSKNCANINWNKLNSDVKSLFLSEIYLRERFSGPKKLDSVLEEFVKTLNLQHKHELLGIRPSKLSIKALEERIKAIQKIKSSN